MFHQIDWNKVLDFISQFTTSEITKQRLQGLSPIGSNEAIKSMKDIVWAQEYVHEARPRIECIDITPIWMKRLSKGAILSTYEIKDLSYLLVDTSNIRSALQEIENNEWAENKISELTPLTDLEKQVSKTVDSEGNILPDASPELSKLYRERAQLTQGVHSQLKSILQDKESDIVLQDKFVTTREGRWVVPVKYGMQGKLKGIIHDVSNSGQSLYIEPEGVVKQNNKLREVEVAIKNEMERILKQLSQALYDQVDTLKSNYECLKEIDFYFALASWNEAIDGKPIEFDNDLLEIFQLRNPVLSFQQDEVISNHIEMSKKESVLLISGPNAGGKTILLKSLGLAAQMARCGLPVAADKNSRIPYFENIYISVGDSQNIKEGLSTFAAHVEELNHSFHAKPYKDLVLIDEICGSTDPEEGAAIARAFLKHYADSHIYNLTTSHLSPLKTNWPENSGVQIGSMDFDEAHGVPNYKLLLGVSGSSFAWKTAKKLGMPESILTMAKEFLSEDWKSQHKTLDDLEKKQEELNTEKAQVERLKREHQLAKENFEKLQIQFEKEKDIALKNYVNEAEKRLADYLEELKENKSKNIYEVKADLPNIIKAKPERPLTKEEFIKLYPIGSEVFISTLNKKGIVQSEPNKKMEVQILSQSMRMDVGIQYISKQEIKPKENIFKPKKKQLLEGGDTDLDLRGMSMEDALDELERNVDAALQAGSDRLKVIHGHGTGVLKKAIRNYCARNSFIKRWQVAPKDKGGDGVTWIEL